MKKKAIDHIFDGKIKCDGVGIINLKRVTFDELETRLEVMKRKFK